MAGDTLFNGPFRVYFHEEKTHNITICVRARFVMPKCWRNDACSKYEKGQGEHMVRADETGKTGRSQHGAADRAQRGAALSIALLLLLICALLTSAVIAAMSAVGGQPLNLAKRDQHYYSATSAVKLLKDEIDNTSVTFRCVKEESTPYEVTYENGGKVGPPRAGKPAGKRYALTLVVGEDDRASSENNDVELDDTGDSVDGKSLSTLTFPQIAAFDYLSKSTGALTGTVNAESFFENASNVVKSGGDDTPLTRSFTLEHTVTSEGLPANLPTILETDIAESIAKDGTLTCTVKSGDDRNTEYWLDMICEADVEAEQDEYSTLKDDGMVPTVGKITRTETTTKTTTLLIKVTWSASDISKSVA